MVVKAAINYIIHDFGISEACVNKASMCFNDHFV